MIIGVCVSFEIVIAFIQNYLDVLSAATWQDTARLNPELVLTRVYGTLKPSNPNLFGGYLIAAVPFLWLYTALNFVEKHHKRFLILLIFSILAIPAIFMTGCRGAYIALFFMIITLLVAAYNICKFHYPNVYDFVKKYLFSIKIMVILSGGAMNKLRNSIRVTAADGLSDYFVRLYKDFEIEDKFLAEIFGEIERLSAKITTAIMQDRVKSSLAEKDRARNEEIRKLNALLKGYAVFPSAEKRECAKRLLAVFEKYGLKITSENYSSKSSLIESILEDFSGEQEKNDAASLDGVVELIQSLRNAENDFYKANDEFVRGRALKNESAYSIKGRLVRTINEKLVPYLSAMSIADNSAYGNFAQNVERQIKKLNSAVPKTKKSPPQ